MAKWGKCDFKELKKFQEKIEKMANADVDKFCEEVSKELAARLLAKVIKRTPVGTRPKLGINKTIKSVGKSGKSKTFLSKEGAILQQYWSGYVGGTLRRGWTARTEAEARNGTGNGKNAKEYADSLKVVKRGNDYIIVVENPVHYADYVEYGHRQEIGRYVPQLGKKLKAGWVDGKFMLTISEKELKSQSNKVIEKKLMQLLGECFK